MTVETGSPPEPASPGDFTPRQLRVLKAAVVVMAVILVGGFAVILGTIVYQTTQLAESGAGSGKTLVRAFDIAIGRDRTLQSLTLDGNRVALHLRGAAGREIAIVDLTKGRVVSRIRLRPE